MHQRRCIQPPSRVRIFIFVSILYFEGSISAEEKKTIAVNWTLDQILVCGWWLRPERRHGAVNGTS